ncbi:NCS2 family permease [Clostridium chauvoei]|uniref:NCS2 family permease n=1 Tax=Clostridium chauvoei TaxID=46867 RepID=UPI001C84E1B1|nr:NCS2 family permease [Clostridium chauvoei]MBX7412803.1 NCS2 family permease [Clostridium chauvoei]MBX7417828.1 NCS2 family permease [Clostridium chauvoei]
MEKLFKLKEHGVNVKTEAIAAFTSFFAAVYIIVVNASILSDGGIPMEPLIIATVLASLFGCLLVAFISNTPLIVMPGMGINALFTYTIVNTLGLTFYQALGAVFVAGILFVVIALTPLAKILTEAIPASLKEAITVGIGLFITFIGLHKAGIVVASDSTLVKLGDITSPEVLAFIIIMIITLILFLKNVPGAFLISIILGTLISIGFGIVDLSSISFSLPDFNAYKDIFFSMDFSAIATPTFWVATFSLTLVLVFENIGLLHGQVSGMLKRPEETPKALHSVAYSVIDCGIFGTSPNVSTVEGAAGIAAGGKTGLTSLITGLLFLLSLFFIPFIKIIPNAAISPILIIIGCLMSQNLKNLNFDDLTELFPAFVTIVLIPLTYSIVDGIAFGFILYPICKLCTKKGKDVSVAMYVVSAIFLVYFILHGMQH